MPTRRKTYKLLNFSQMTHFCQQAFVDGQRGYWGSEYTGSEAADNCL